MLLSSLLGQERVSNLIGTPQFDTLEALLDNELANNQTIRKELSGKVQQALKEGATAGPRRRVVFRTATVVDLSTDKPSGK
jgi:hypothetical protein